MSTISSDLRTEWSEQLARALVTRGLLPDYVVLPVLARARDAEQPLATLLISEGVATPAVVVSTLAQLAQLPSADLESDPPAQQALEMVPPDIARAYGVVGVRSSAHHLIVAFGEPPDTGTLRALSRTLSCEIMPVLADPTVIARLLPPDAPVVTATPNGNGTAHHVAAEPAAPVPAPELPTHPEVGHTGGLHLDDLLRYVVSIGASDLHLAAGNPPSVRLHGALRPMEDVGLLRSEEVENIIFGILPPSQRARFEKENELDTSYAIEGVSRFRVNVARERGDVAGALRPIPQIIPKFESLGLPPVMRSFADLRRGLVLVTGPTGSGKSTSLASLVDIINETKPLHIITVEDPIEFLHHHKRSVISQREVGEDTASFSEALRRVLRQDPDVILVGEMRDLETIQTALTAAETGHLVFGTLHTQDASSTIDRVIDVFPPNQQDQIRIQLSSTLEAVVTQQLVPVSDGNGRCVAAEVLIATSGVRNLIRSAKTHQIYSLMQTGAQVGMQTMDQSLAQLVREGVITLDMALDRCRDEEELSQQLSSYR
jgi:twitching motility protein PilT